MAFTTENTFTGNGSTTDFSFTFPYIAEADVKVTITDANGDPQSNTDFTFANATTLSFDTAPTSGRTIRIFRDTNLDSAVVTYFAGSAIRAEDLNDNQNQVLFSAQEVENNAVLTTGSTMKEPLILDDTELKITEGTDTLTLDVPALTDDHTISFPNVSGTVVTTGDANTVTGTMIANDAINGDRIADDSINSEHYAAGSIDLEHMSANSVDSDQYVDGSIDRVHLAADIIDGTKLADNAVDSEHYTDGSIDRVHLAADIVDGTKIADDSIDSEHIVADSIDSEHYAAGSVDTTALAADAVNGAKIADNAIDSEHYTDGSIDRVHLAADIIDGTKLADDAVNSEHIANGAVDLVHMSANSVDSDQYVDGSIDRVHLAADIVDGTKLADNAVDSEHYTDGSIDRVHLAADIVDGTKIADDSIDSEHYVDQSIDAAHLATSAVTTAKIAGDAIDHNKIADDAVRAEHIDGLTATITELNQLDGNTLSNSVSDWTSGTTFPSAAQISNRLAEFGGFEAIADDESFPNTAPAEGVIISIADAGGLEVNSSGTSTNGDTLNDTTVTINEFPPGFNSTTLDDGIGLLVVKDSGSGHTYDFHRVVAKNEDVRQLSSDINDFKARYRTGSDNPTTDNDAGDLFFNTGSNKMLVRNGDNDAWEEVQSIGEYFIIPSSDFPTWNGTINDISITDNAPANAEQILLSINGVIQEPNSGTDRPTDGFSLSGSTIRLSAAPATGSEAWGVIIGSTVNIGTPSNATVSEAKLNCSNDPTNDHVLTADSSVTGGLKWAAIPAVDSDKIEEGNTNVECVDSGSDGHILFDTEGSERMRIDSSGRVGIGTATPSSMLNLSGADPTITLSDTDGTNDIVTIEGVSGAARITARDGNADGEIIFRKFDGTTHDETMRITNGGNVGIGVNNPESFFNSNLVVGNTSTANTGITIASSTSGTGRLIFADADSDPGRQDGLITYSQNDRALAFATATNERMRIDSSGRLLIGTSTARTDFSDQTSGLETRVQIEGTSWNTSTLSIIRNSDNASDGEIVFAKSRGGSGNVDAVQSGDDLGAISFQGSDGTTFQQGVKILAEASANASNNNLAANLKFFMNSGGTGVVEVMSIEGDGNVSINDGNLVVASGHGIDFSATGNSSGTMSSELLDDYEEGTWTPTFVSESSPDPTISYAIQLGRYLKVGNRVWLTGYVNVSTVSGGTNNVWLSGFPFTNNASSSTNRLTTVDVGHATGWDNNEPSGGYLRESQVGAYLTRYNGAHSLIPASDLANNCDLYFSLNYATAA